MLFYNSFIILLSISLSATDPLPRGPNLCADSYVDSAFSVGKEIFLTRDDWIWKIKDITQIDSPFRQIDLSFLRYEKFKTGFSITTIPSCDSSENCEHLKKAKDLVIILFQHDFSGDQTYMSYRLLVNGKLKEINDEKDMPWNLPNVSLPRKRIWPPNWTIFTNFRPSAFTSFNNELLFIINGKTGDKNKFVWYNIRDAMNQKLWKESEINLSNKLVFVGIFELNDKYYAIAEERGINRLALVFRYDVVDGKRNLTFMSNLTQFFGCFKSTQKPEANSENNSKNIALIVIILFIFVALFVFAVMAVFLFFRNKLTTTASSGVSGVSRVPSTTSSHNESVYTIHSVTGETINSKIQ